MNKFFKLYRQQNNQLVVALVDDRYFKNQPIAGGQIIGQIAILIENGYWRKGKKVMADAVCVDADTFAALCSQYGTPAAPWFPGPRKEAVKKSDTDKKTYALRQAMELSQYKEDTEEVCTFEGYTWWAADAARLLKAMNSEFNKPTKKQLAMFAAVDAEPAPVADAPAADDTKPAAAPLIQAAKETGHLIICSVPKAEQPAAPVVDANAADDAPATPVADEQPAAPSIKNTDTPSNQKKQFAAWRGAIVEILEICTADNTAVVKIKGGSRTRIPADALEQTTAKKTTLPAWMMPGAVIDVKNAVRNDAPPARHTIESVKATNIYYTDGTYSSINYIMHYGGPVDEQTAAPVVDVPAADTAALTDADVLAAAARIKSNYEAMKQQASADAYADAITAYCAALEEPAAPAWSPEVIILKEQPAAPAVDAAPAPRRRRLNVAPRLLRRLHRARWVAVAFVVCLLSGLLLGMNTSNAAADADADDIAAVYELAPVTITAAAVTDAPAAADAVTTSNQKTASDIAAVTDAPAADAVAPSNQKTASDIAAVADAPAAADADGLTICAGTAWAYTMMNWA